MRRFGLLRWLFAAAVLVTAAATPGCASKAPEPTVFRYEVPLGTRRLTLTNRAPVIFPSELVVRVGDSIVIVNEDDYDIDVGPYRVMAHSTLRQRFSSPGELSGSCSVAAGGELTVRILPKTA
ncbi:MAG TPA: hypothetical protein PLV93_07370 [Microthrixaceae bacterium]|nr:hypothetical protein [Microthrixaceae bacterium]HNI35204.1 hypothetical protein [Microthrixaceae bacterium]